MDVEVAIVGGGVLGLSTAYHLSKLRIATVLFEREALIGSHASGRNAGMFRQLYRHPQLTEWALRSRESWPQSIREKSFVETGSVIVGRKVPKHHHQLFSESSFGRQPAVITKSDGLLDPGSYVNEIYSAIDKRYVRVLKLSEVNAVEINSKRVFIYLHNGETIESQAVVNAAGAWTNDFMPSTLRLPCLAYARHLFVVHGWPENFMPFANCGYFWDEPGKWYLRKWDKHSRLISLCDETPCRSPQTYCSPETLKERLAERLSELVPDVYEGLSLSSSWFCFRTYTEDRLPVWGADPREPKLFWLSAFGGLGMSTSFAATLDAARSILGLTAGLSSEVAGFSSSRFNREKEFEQIHPA